ncbi:tail protein [Endozoicomonas montiporae]|uniref:Tail protein n=2 Tax=Endozoicomonas montiporae TaxID=1027273 RepID=A0A081N7T8_9GAMM|nr:phage tail sheath subtilisin-like domain-containing protein [Endozoicomonas montiporae]AMO55623.1 tail sheath protein [Endozoicomonas montiporae CL-33]AMO58107.1 tail sheath protein [Endozoicomonas montiporae CL-33]KEQ14511.1 tail protein [Endozoicomonas montiporae]
MATDFLHGVEVVEIDGGTRPIRTVKSSVIGLIGTAPNADPIQFPVNTPVLIAGNRTEAAALGDGGTLPSAIDGIFDQVGAAVVVVRVEEGSDDADTLSNVIGGVGAGGEYEGVHAFLGAKSIVGVQPRILCAPNFSHKDAGGAELVVVAERLRAVAIIDGPNTDDAAAKTYADNFGSHRAYLVDPWVRVWDTSLNAETVEPASARVAGMIARSDNERGFWWSPSNTEMRGIIGTARPVDFALGDVNSRANLLNEENVSTIIRENGFRLWGNRTLGADPQWAFLSVRRTADIIQDSIQRAHLWAVDRNITKTYVENVTDGVNAYLRELKALGAIQGGKCWADAELNTKESIQAGKVYFDFDFGPFSPAERITFRSHLNNDYLEEIVA